MSSLRRLVVIAHCSMPMPLLSHGGAGLRLSFLGSPCSLQIVGSTSRSEAGEARRLGFCAEGPRSEVLAHSPVTSVA